MVKKLKSKILINDIHFGKFNDSIDHNERILKFFDFVLQIAKNRSIDDIVIQGDYFENRHQYNGLTLDYALKGIHRLSKNHKVTMIKGNHDLFYRDRRDISPLNSYRDINNVRVVEYYDIQDDEMYVSWIVNPEEFDEVVEISKNRCIRHIYGHFEFSSFKMNENYKMKHGYSHRSLSHIEKIFTGHYHKRQERDNIIYVGNPFAFDYSDANDNAKGLCIVNSDGTHEFVDYNLDRKIYSMNYKDFLSVDTIADPGSIRVVVDDVISNEMYEQIQAKLDLYNLDDKKIVVKNESIVNQEVDIVSDAAIKSIDEIVKESIFKMCDTMKGDIDKHLLYAIYEGTDADD